MKGTNVSEELQSKDCSVVHQVQTLCVLADRGTTYRCDKTLYTHTNSTNNACQKESDGMHSSMKNCGYHSRSTVLCRTVQPAAPGVGPHHSAAQRSKNRCRDSNMLYRVSPKPSRYLVESGESECQAPLEV